MKVAVVHYHLRKGGVTRVIEDAIAALAPHDVEIVVLSGEPYLGDRIPQARVVEGLGYQNEAELSAAEDLTRRLEREAREALGSAPDLWHIHNHSLGKNVAFPAVVRNLARDGARLLLQIHDFAEDGRPANYTRQLEFNGSGLRNYLYPNAPQIHYAPLNRRDADHLRSAGLPESQLHLLPNSVSAPPQEEPATPIFSDAEQFLVYPTRGIRRKNIGELLLLSCLSGTSTVFASTLRPANPEWLPFHQRWEQFLERHPLPVHLAYCEESSHTYPELMARADAVVTTSVAEGFGLAFLEPWLIGKTVVGRNLPAITSDFNLPLDHLYDRLDVPLAWIDSDLFRRKLAQALQASLRSYGRTCTDEHLEQAWSAAVKEDRVDFGRLDEDLQEEALLHALARPHEVQCPDLSPLSNSSRYRSHVATHFNAASYGERLEEIYTSVLDASPGPVESLDANALLQAFLDPGSFTLLRT